MKVVERRDIIKGLAITMGAMASRSLIAAVGETTLPMPVAATPMGPELSKPMQEKIDNFDEDFEDDVYLSKDKFPILVQTLKRLGKVQDAIGYARFNLLSFDEMLKAAANYPTVGALTKVELGFIEEIFFFDAKKYGFFGEKVTPNLTMKIDDRNAVKIAGSGHYVYKGRPLALYQEIVRDVGNSIVLTSGIRSVVKQLYLFLAKASNTDGNLSRASRSLAPPGHSFHGISDFDVGKIGWGSRNFTDQFAKSDIFKRLIDLGYVDIRYPKINSFGVRFEPWHIKVG